MRLVIGRAPTERDTPHSCAGARARRRARRARGFTLMELMVAITGGLFVSIAVFSLARFGSHFYQQETRVADATMSSVVGFERLKTDISRAGFLVSPNALTDARVCGQPATDASWPLELKRLAALRIDRDFLQGHAMLDTAINGNIKPDAITLAGSYDSGDEYPISNIQQIGAGYNVYLQQLTGAMSRLGGANLATVFKPGRGLRIVDESGKQQYGTITGTTVIAGEPVVTLSQAPQLILRQATDQQCGFKGHGTGARASVVNFVRYELRDLSANAAHAAVFADSANIPNEAGRVELVRYEVDTAGGEIAGTQELVAELAVDLAFGITSATFPTNDGNQELNVTLPNAADVTTIAGDTTGGAQPQRVRSVRARLSVRSREGDRSGNVVPSTTVAPGLYRIALIPGAAVAEQRYARVRTLQADIALPNQMGAAW